MDASALSFCRARECACPDYYPSNTQIVSQDTQCDICGHIQLWHFKPVTYSLQQIRERQALGQTAFERCKSPGCRCPLWIGPPGAIQCQLCGDKVAWHLASADRAAEAEQPIPPPRAGRLMRSGTQPGHGNSRSVSEGQHPAFMVGGSIGSSTLPPPIPSSPSLGPGSSLYNSSTSPALITRRNSPAPPQESFEVLNLNNGYRAIPSNLSPSRPRTSSGVPQTPSSSLLSADAQARSARPLPAPIPTHPAYQHRPQTNMQPPPQPSRSQTYQTVPSQDDQGGGLIRPRGSLSDDTGSIRRRGHRPPQFQQQSPPPMPPPPLTVITQPSPVPTYTERPSFSSDTYMHHSTTAARQHSPTSPIASTSASRLQLQNPPSPRPSVSSAVYIAQDGSQASSSQQGGIGSSSWTSQSRSDSRGPTGEVQLEAMQTHHSSDSGEWMPVTSSASATSGPSPAPAPVTLISESSPPSSTLATPSARFSSKNLGVKVSPAPGVTHFMPGSTLKCTLSLGSKVNLNNYDKLEVSLVGLSTVFGEPSWESPDVHTFLSLSKTIRQDPDSMHLRKWSFAFTFPEEMNCDCRADPLQLPPSYSHEAFQIRYMIELHGKRKERLQQNDKLQIPLSFVQPHNALADNFETDSSNSVVAGKDGDWTTVRGERQDRGLASSQLVLVRDQRPPVLDSELAYKLSRPPGQAATSRSARVYIHYRFSLFFGPSSSLNKPSMKEVDSSLRVSLSRRITTQRTTGRTRHRNKPTVLPALRAAYKDRKNDPEVFHTETATIWRRTGKLEVTQKEVMVAKTCNTDVRFVLAGNVSSSILSSDINITTPVSSFIAPEASESSGSDLDSLRRGSASTSSIHSAGNVPSSESGGYAFGQNGDPMVPSVGVIGLTRRNTSRDNVPQPNGETCTSVPNHPPEGDYVQEVLSTSTSPGSPIVPHSYPPSQGSLPFGFSSQPSQPQHISPPQPQPLPQHIPPSQLQNIPPQHFPPPQAPVPSIPTNHVPLLPQQPQPPMPLIPFGPQFPMQVSPQAMIPSPPSAGAGVPISGGVAPPIGGALPMSAVSPPPPLPPPENRLSPPLVPWDEMRGILDAEADPAPPPAYGT